MSLAFLEALSMAVWLNKTDLEQGEREKNESRAVVPSTLFTSMTFDEGSVDSVCEREFSKILSGVVVVFVHLEGIYKRKELGTRPLLWHTLNFKSNAPLAFNASSPFTSTVAAS